MFRKQTIRRPLPTPRVLRLLLRFLRRILPRSRSSLGLVVAVLLVMGGCKSTRADYPTDVKVFVRLDELVSGQILDQVSGQPCTWHGTDAIQDVGGRVFKSIATSTGGVTVPATILDAIRPGGFWKGPHTVLWWQYGPETNVTGVLGVAGVPGQWYPFLAPTGGEWWDDYTYVQGLQLRTMRPDNQTQWGQFVPEWNSVTLGATWALVVVRWDPTTGVQSLNKSESKWSRTQPVNANQHAGGGGGGFTLGTSGTWAGPGNRLIGSLGIFDRVITDAEVTEIVNLGPGFIPGYWDDEDPGEEPGGGGPEFSQLVAIMQAQNVRLAAIEDHAETVVTRSTGLYFYAIAGVQCLVVLAGLYLFRISKFSMNSKTPLAIAAAFLCIGGSSFAQAPDPCLLWERTVGKNLNGNQAPPVGPYDVTCVGASSFELVGDHVACNVPNEGRVIRVILRYHPQANGMDVSQDWIIKCVCFTSHGSGPENSDAHGDTRYYGRKVSDPAGSPWRQLAPVSVAPCKDCGQCDTCIYAELFEIYSDNQDNPAWPKGRGSRNQYELIGSGQCTPPPPGGTGSGGDPGGGTGGNGGGGGFPGGPGDDDDDDGTPNGQDPDRDGDGQENPQDGDDDGDGIPDGEDPTPNGPPDDGEPGTNPGDPGNDEDEDGVEDPQDPDDDNDGIPDENDPSQYGPCVLNTGAADVDCDGINDTMDPCIATIKDDIDCDDVRDIDDVCPEGDDLMDSDADGVPNDCDNCPGSPNPEQKNSDGDENGDACDDDDDNDGKDDGEDDDDDGDGIPDVDEDQCEEPEGDEETAQCGCARVLDSFYYRLSAFLTGDRGDVGAGYRTGDGDPGSQHYVPGGEGGIFTYLFDSRRKMSSWGQPASGGNGEDPPEDPEDPEEGTPTGDKNRLPIPFVDLEKFKDLDNYNLPQLEYMPIELDWDEGVFYDGENVLEWDFLDFAHMIKNVAAIGLIWGYGTAIIFAFFKSAT